MDKSMSVDYSALANFASRAPEPFQEAAIRELTDAWCEKYEDEYPQSQVSFIEDKGAQYIFDRGADAEGPSPRTIAAFGSVNPDIAPRDTYYQAGFPLPERQRPIDRGHLMPHSAGGLFGPNIIPQDRALNRGWSAQGKRYRAMERRAISRPGNILFCRPIYTDATDYPERIDLGFVSASRIYAETFLNREDSFVQRVLAGQEPNNAELTEILDFLTVSELGDVGEETARAYLEDRAGATIVALGDSKLPRQHGRQDLDVLAIVDDELVAYEVKTTYSASLAGRRTVAGNLYSPPLRRKRRRADGIESHDQSSDAYILDRVANVIDVDDEVLLTSRVIKVDLKGLVLQQFNVEQPGLRRRPISPVVDCIGFVRTAIASIIGHRGSL